MDGSKNINLRPVEPQIQSVDNDSHDSNSAVKNVKQVEKKFQQESSKVEKKSIMTRNIKEQVEDTKEEKNESLVDERAKKRLKEIEIIKSYHAQKDYFHSRRVVDLQKSLGEGSFGEVRSASITTPSNKELKEQDAAFKMILEGNTTGQEYIDQENEILSKIDSPYIINISSYPIKNEEENIKDMVINTKNMVFDQEKNSLRLPTDSDDSKDEFNVVHSIKENLPGLAMGLKDSNLEDAMSKLTTEEKTLVFHDILQGLVYLKEKKIAHCDIKPENILLDSSKRAAITDFGLASEMKSDTKLHQVKGTILYMSPDALKNKFVLDYTSQWDQTKLTFELAMIDRGYNAYELDAWGAGMCIVQLYLSHLRHNGKLAIYQLATNIKGQVLQELGILRLNKDQEEKMVKDFDTVLNKLIEFIGDNVHKNVAIGLLKNKWTVEEALNYLIKNEADET